MHQIGIDICNLPESDGFKHLVVCIDYFSKWSEAKPLRNKNATSIAKFLYELICRHGCMKIQINDQGREFVNNVIAMLHKMTGTEQRVTSAYHPQANGLCERQNRTIKEALVKVLNENPTEWPDIIDGVLFAHRVSRHSSTKYSPYFLLYNREPVIPVDVKYSLDDDNGYMHESDENKPFDKEMFDAVLSASMSMRDKLHNQASENIQQAQKKQRRDYNRRHQVPNSITVGQKVLLLNQKRMDRKGGKFAFKFLGPYTVLEVSEKNLCTLQNKTGASLKKKYNVSLLKTYIEGTSFDVDDGTSPFTKVNEKPLDLWTILPNEIVEKILINAVQLSNNVAETFQSLLHTCVRFQEIISPKKDSLLSSIHIPYSENELGSFPRRSNMIKVSVRKLTSMFGPSSGVVMSLQTILNNRKWKSAWLLLREKEHSWFLVERCFWKTCSKKRRRNEGKEGEFDQNVSEIFWLKNDMYNLKVDDEKILLSPFAWINDNIMDAAQKLICRQLGDDEEYQSVLYVQKHFRPVNNEHIQLLHDGSQHWFLTFCSNGRVQVCDSLKKCLNRVSKKSVQALYKNCVDDRGKLLITFLPVQQQMDGYNCGLFAIAFASEILEGKSPIDAHFDVTKMREHLILCLENQHLTPFPTVLEEVH